MPANKLRTERTHERGLTLAEILAVVAIAGIVLAVAVPLVADRIREARIRGAVDEYVVSLKAARMVATTRRANCAVTVNADPGNSFSYTDNYGRLREFTLPNGLEITATTDPITFEPNGACSGGATTVIELDMSDGVTERWTVTVNTVGVTDVVREKV